MSQKPQLTIPVAVALTLFCATLFGVRDQEPRRIYTAKASEIQYISSSSNSSNNFTSSSTVGNTDDPQSLLSNTEDPQIKELKLELETLKAEMAKKDQGVSP